MKKTLIFILISSLYFACLTKVDEKIVTNNSQINLAWYKAHQKDSIQGAAIGLECYIKTSKTQQNMNLKTVLI